MPAKITAASWNSSAQVTLGQIGTVRTFNVMNQHPEGVGTCRRHAKPEALGLDWNIWCGPAPLRKFNRTLAA